MQAHIQIRQRLNTTGIGYAGIEGAWWLPAVEPFSLPATLAEELTQIGQAIFTLFDVVTGLYGTAAGATIGLKRLLEEKVPPHILRLIEHGPILSVRPDFQLVRLPNGGLQPVATELEIAPSAQGFAHAMQVGYGLPTDLVAAFARFLQERTLLIVGTEEWSEFLWEQLALCRALAEVGARGRVLYDLPIHTLAQQVAAGKRWQPPIFGVPTKPTHWHDDVLGRLRAAKLADYLWLDDEDWPASVGDAVVFRFGYFDCFAPEKLRRLVQWREQGATFLNPTHFIFDSKVIMAALGLPAVRQQIEQVQPGALPVLDRCIPETRLLEPALIEQLCREQDDWVIKFAGYDRGNQAWGGRSLQLGAQQSPERWRAILQESLTLPWPVVAQRATPSAQIDIAYFDENDAVRWLVNGSTRLRTFFLREPDHGNRCVAAGSHLTVVAGEVKVAEGVAAVQAPVVFNGKKFSRNSTYASTGG